MSSTTRLGVYGIAVEHGRLLLVTKAKGWYTGLLDLPGGGVEFGESAEDTLAREFLEETGMRFETMRLFDNVSYVNDQDNNRFHHLGQLYFVSGLNVVEGSSPEDEFNWYELQVLSPHQLTPFAELALTALEALVR